MSGFALVEEGEEGCLFWANVATISACHRYNYRSFRQESRTSIRRSPLRSGMERCTTSMAICRCLSMRRVLWRLSGFLVPQLVINGNATQAEISRAFGVPLVTVKRYVKLYREHGAAAFFAPAKKRSGSKLTAEVCQKVQGLLDQGLTVPEVGREVGILSNTLHKAIRAGRLRPGKKKIYPTMR